MKKNLSLLFAMLFMVGLFIACGNSEGENDAPSDKPLGNIVGKTLLLKKDNGVKMLIEHISKEGVVISNVTVDNGKKNAPSYAYSVKNANSANYQLNFTKKTYIPYYKDYVYSSFDIDVDLIFTSSSVGKFSGVQLHNGIESHISGTFIFDPEEGVGEDKGTGDDDDETGIHLSDCVIVDIGSSSIDVYGKVTLIGAGASLTERGFCIGTSSTPTQRIKCDNETGEQNLLVEGLKPFTLYYVRQYAVLGGKTLYGKEITVVTATTGGQYVPGEEFMVDMGVSVKWAKGNLCVNSDGTGHIANNPSYIPPYRRYSETATEWDFFCWADPSGIKTYETVRYPDYNSIPKQISGIDDDIAHMKLGGKWRLPTIDEWRELIGNSTCQWVYSNGTMGLKIVSTNGNSIFLPAAGWGAGYWIYWRGEKGNYWSGDLAGSGDELHARSFSFDKDSQSVYTLGELDTHMYCVRPVSDY